MLNLAAATAALQQEFLAQERESKVKAILLPDARFDLAPCCVVLECASLMHPSTSLSFDGNARRVYADRCVHRFLMLGVSTDIGTCMKSRQLHHVSSGLTCKRAKYMNSHLSNLLVSTSTAS